VGARHTIAKSPYFQTQKLMKKRIIAYIFAVLSTYVLAVILVSQFNISNVQDMGFAVSFNQRLAAIAHDLVGMLGLYLPLLAIGLLIALSFTGLVLMRFIKQPQVLYPLAGFVGVVALHSILHMVLGLSGIAPTRTPTGLLSQGLAGAVGGYVYLRIRFSNS
jgi:hypothetical protein